MKKILVLMIPETYLAVLHSGSHYWLMLTPKFTKMHAQIPLIEKVWLANLMISLICLLLKDFQ